MKSREIVRLIKQKSHRVRAHTPWKYYAFFDSLFERKVDLKQIDSDTIQKVVEELETEHWRWDGIPVSVLINRSPEQKIRIETEGEWNYMGMFNTKNLIIEGDVGDCAGCRMPKGKIEIKGSAGNLLGCCIKGGKIMVEGSAGDVVGPLMSGGEIMIKRDAGNGVGDSMTGGRIIIEGNAGNFVGVFMGGGVIVIKGYAGEYIGTRMEDGEIYVANLDPEKLRYDKICGGAIYRGLPEEMGGKQPELIWGLKVLGEPDSLLLYFNKKK